jgi:GT2 family glycosyltransferase
MNMGAEYAVNQLNADYILLWNNDIFAMKNYFQSLLQIIKESNQDVIYGSKIYSNIEKSIIWSMGGVFQPKRGNFYMIGYNEVNSQLFEKEQLANWLPGMGTLIPRKVILHTGYWDPINFPQYHGDVDYTYRAGMNGFTILVSPQLCLFNDTSHSGNKEINTLKDLILSFSDRKSLYNIPVNLIFFRKYSTSIFAYNYLIKMYFRYIGGFFKWKLLHLFGIKRPNHA